MRRAFRFELYDGRLSEGASYSMVPSSQYADAATQPLIGIQFNQFVNSVTGTSQGVWIVDDLNSLSFNYVLRVCSTAP